jgi:hypothetical protein
MGILFTSSFGIQATAAPNENANEKAHERATFQIPDNAVEIAPGIFSLGTIEVNGQILEGVMSYHHRNGHNGGPSGGGDDPIVPTDSSSCYSYIFDKPIQWTAQESWVVNPDNNSGLPDNTVFDILVDGFSAWETAAGTEILGDGSITSDTLEADTQSTDGINEIYFADISEPGVIGVTITWGVVNGPPFARGLVEMDQVYDDVSFDWATNGDATKMDFGNVATHEIGHGLGMGHTSLDDLCKDQTMYPYTSNGVTSGQTLEDGDIAGIQNLY